MNSIFKSIVIVLALLVGNTSFASPKELYIQRKIEELNTWSNQQPVVDPAKIQSGVYSQTLNHDDLRDKRTFGQRYHVNTTYAVNSQSPTLLYVCGEARCDQSSVTWGAIVQAAQALQANIIAVEHRYYGGSHPFATLETANLKYLTTDYALKDLDIVQKWAVQKFGFRGKWIAVGGSYPGSLAAYYRANYPQNVVGALASSAPVLAKANFEEYDRHVTKVAGTQCAEKMREAVTEVEARLKSPTQKLAVKKLFDAERVPNDIDFLYVIADMAAFAVQYGYHQKFCNALTSSTDVVAAYAQVGKEVFAMFGLNSYKDSFASAESITPDPNAPFEFRQWMYQSCTEYGYYQVAHQDSSLSTRSAQIDLPYHNEVCKRLFGLSQEVDTKTTNRLYYEKVLDTQTSNIFLTNGEQDPWINLSLTESSNATNPNLSMMTIAGAAHCDDLRSSGGTAVQAAKAKFISLARQWLK